MSKKNAERRKIPTQGADDQKRRMVPQAPGADAVIQAAIQSEQSGVPVDWRTLCLSQYQNFSQRIGELARTLQGQNAEIATHQANVEELQCRLLAYAKCEPDTTVLDAEGRRMFSPLGRLLPPENRLRPGIEAHEDLDDRIGVHDPELDGPVTDVR